jgi:hypothetical protein
MSASCKPSKHQFADLLALSALLLLAGGKQPQAKCIPDLASACQQLILCTIEGVCKGHVKGLKNFENSNL